MRKENIVTLVDGGEEKTFKIKQMSATRGERFIFKLIMLLGGQTQVESLTDPYALLGALSSKPFERVQELLDELIGCISRVNGGVETQLTPDNADGFIEDSMTLLQLRVEVLKLNNFFHLSGMAQSTESNDVSVMIKRKG
jgi:hypothetical protein